MFMQRPSHPPELLNVGIESARGRSFTCRSEVTVPQLIRVMNGGCILNVWPGQIVVQLHAAKTAAEEKKKATIRRCGS